MNPVQGWLARVVGRGASACLVATLLVVAGLAGCSRHHPTKPPEGDRGPGPVIFPAYQESPDYSRTGLLAYVDFGILCVRSNGGSIRDPDLRGIWVLDPSTGEKQRILDTNLMLPAWSPDGSVIAACTPYDGAIWIFAVDGSWIRPITGPDYCFAPRWSADGQWLCWRRSGVLEIARSDGSDRSSTGRIAPGGADWHPRSPDTLVYAGPGEEQYSAGLYVYSVTTRQSRLLATAPGGFHYPRWSPDGRFIACEHFDPDPAHTRVSVYDVATGREELHFGLKTWKPTWLPSGAALAFQSWDCYVVGPSNGVIDQGSFPSGTVQQLTYPWPERCDSTRTAPPPGRAGRGRERGDTR